MFDSVIRGGTVVDGTGSAPFTADVAVKDGMIVAVGSALDLGDQEIDAAGRIVTPGFVDIHTHYDGQATWATRLTPSSGHGVTTVVMGNCGVGFAPCRTGEGDRATLVRLMEGVEDIPGAVLRAGLPWRWEHFSDYLGFIASHSYDVDVAAYVPHAALRTYVMGERALRCEASTAADRAEMQALLRDALEAGAAGVSVSASQYHRTSDGHPIPTRGVALEELLALADTLRRCGRGTFQLFEDIHALGRGLGHAEAIAEACGRPVTFSLILGNDDTELHGGRYRYQDTLAELDALNARGLFIKGQVLPRAIGAMMGFGLTLNPFYTTRSFRALLDRPLDERLATLRRPEVRTAILKEPVDAHPTLAMGEMVRHFENVFILGDPPDYEQGSDRSVAAQARAQAIAPEALAYDTMLTGQLLYLTLGNYPRHSLDAVGEALDDPNVVLGLGDGGAHVASICDASYSTYALLHWGRDRPRDRKTLPSLVHKMTQATAQVMGFEDRGVLRPGLRADLNVIDLDGLALAPPRVVHDLPGGGHRLTQDAHGFVLTMVRGSPSYRDGQSTGAMAGRLIRCC